MDDEMARGGVLVHEWLERTGGSENVFEVMATEFPSTPIVASWNNAPHRFPAERVRETWLAKTPLRRSKSIAALALPAAWRSRKLAEEATWGLISSHMFAHHVRLPRGAPKLVYVHTPARYVWSPELDPRGGGVVAKTLSAGLKRIDRERAAEATSLAANSAYVRDRIRRHWGRDATVLHPPVAIDAVRASVAAAEWQRAGDIRSVLDLPEQFLLGVSRFVSYKRLDIVIKAGEAVGLPVVLAGAGPDEAVLRSMAAKARVKVTILTHPSSPVLYELYRRATVLVYPGVEDFGIVPVEAMSVGTPVVGIRAGGLLETVEEEASGVLIDDLRGAPLAEAVRRASSLDRSRVSESVNRFSEAVFRERLRTWVESSLTRPEVFA